MSRRTRVVFFAGYRAKIMEWKGKTLIGVLEFEPDDDGYMMFFDYIAKSTKTPTALLLDLIEEDFQKTTIPKVNARDRKGVIDRLLDKHYRGNTYCHYELQGESVEDKKRLDLVLSSMLNPDVFAPWFNILKESGVALYGIFSIPYLTKHLLKEMQTKGDNILVVSRQVRSAVRESFYKKGRFQFSRFVKLPSEQRMANTPEVTHEIVANGTEHVQHFLRNQRIISYVDIIDVYALVPDDQVQHLPEVTQIDTRKIHYVSLDQVYTRLGLKGCSGQHSDVLFSYLCSTKTVIDNQYALPEEKREYWLQYWQHMALVSSSIISVFLLSLSSLFVTDALNYTREIDSLKRSRGKLESTYEQVYAPIETQISEAYNIQKTVALANYLSDEEKISLQSVFPSIGKVLERDEFSKLHLLSLNWEKLVHSEFQVLLESSKLEVKKPEGELTFDEASDDYEEEDSIPISLVPVARLSGVADRRDMSYAETIVRIEAFIDALKENSEIQNVLAVKLPVDNRLASRFQDQAGLDDTPKEKQLNENVFEFVLVFNGQNKSTWYGTDE